MDLQTITTQLPFLQRLLKHPPEADEAATTPDMPPVVVREPSTGDEIHLSGRVITSTGGVAEIDAILRPDLIASSDGQIYYSREASNEARLRSSIKTIEAVAGAAGIKRAVDAATIDALYREAGQPLESTYTKRTGESLYQTQFIETIRDAAAARASDIHITVRVDKATVEFRQDGVLRPVKTLAKTVGESMVAAIFSMLTEQSHANYQPGSYQFGRLSSARTSLPPGVQGLRLQFNPISNGRHMVARVHYADAETQSLEGLGYTQKEIQQIQTMFARPTGISIFSGKTGSGKSTSLTAALQHVYDRRRGKSGEAQINLMTVEDPVEYEIADGAARQMPVVAQGHDDREEAFSEAMKAALRSDPDWLMVGEIRDLATVELAVEQALAGAPTAASLHANSAMDVLTRLVEMGLKPHLAYDATIFSGLVGQRLVRKTCPNCRVKLEDAIGTSTEIDDLMLERIDAMLEASPEGWSRDDIYVAGPGCAHCQDGYSGRSLVAETIIPDDQFMELLRNGQKAQARDYWFSELGGLDLLGNGWRRVLSGEVSPVILENTVALMRPTPAHKAALERWIGPKPQARD
ncbi:GspE/PulE family protein [Tranquillimonas alkanivorans]|uniref:Type II secretory pathway ATPase GspE/PulE or T4P pilus assembly pathway ATPase PilB n=1 Tax=Tranquillimonas alkanivorans TaxID=441119 RepID=A0A1I5V202_9RHOB|nr:ATPase, T2SS/T4P/T4SS family [Tranquillimonas alkanivorans]SFQ01508.1 Type II secretory pathway ATPase GspE/PulE or T4P pilus assembly pathway ATPase PilB [Tranquillimonas alkanivorans]